MSAKISDAIQGNIGKGRWMVPVGLSVGTWLGIILGLDFQGLVNFSLLIMVVVVAFGMGEYKRLGAAYLAIGILLSAGILSPQDVVIGMELTLLLFLICMSIIVSRAQRSGLFEDLVIGYIIPKMKNRPTMMYLVILILARVLAPQLDEVTSGLIIEAGARAAIDDENKQIRLDPRPLILDIVEATNQGSSYTPIGNPVGIAVLIDSGMDFLWMTLLAILAGLPVAILASIVTVIQRREYIKAFGMALVDDYEGILEKYPQYYWQEEDTYHEDPVKALETDQRGDDYHQPEVEKWIKTANWFILILTLIGLASHTVLEQALPFLGHHSLLLGFSTLGAAASIFLSRNDHEVHTILHDSVHWPVILFIGGLFALAHGLTVTGVDVRLAELVLQLSSDSLLALVFWMYVFAKIITQIMDNVVAVAILGSIIKALMITGGISQLVGAFLWLVLLITATYEGNGTPIGSTINLMLNRSIYKISTMRWIKELWFKSQIYTVIAILILALIFSVLESNNVEIPLGDYTVQVETSSH